jgi:hypothetical protein
MCFYLLFSFYIMFIFPNLLFFLPVLEDYMFSNYLQYLLDYPCTSDDRLLMYHREAFYDAYIPEWEKVCKSTHLINQEKYDEIVALLRTERQPKEPPRCHK